MAKFRVGLIHPAYGERRNSRNNISSILQSDFGFPIKFLIGDTINGDPHIYMAIRDMSSLLAAISLKFLKRSKER